MKKSILLFIFILFNLNIYAKEFIAKYDISYGDFLQLGLAHNILSIKNNNYKIRIEAYTTGMAKVLTNNRVEIYESYGKLINKKFIPNKFIKIKQDKYKKRVRTYTFDYYNKKISLNDKTTDKKRVIDNSFNEEFITISEEKNSELNYFAKDDILSLFFNMQEKISEYESGKEYILNAVGANKTKGLINILMPSKKDYNKINNIIKTDDKIKFKAFINQKIFQSKRGELLISLNDYGFCSYAVLKDVLFFGDIVGKMIEFKINKG